MTQKKILQDNKWHWLAFLFASILYIIWTAWRTSFSQPGIYVAEMFGLLSAFCYGVLFRVKGRSGLPMEPFELPQEKGFRLLECVLPNEEKDILSFHNLVATDWHVYYVKTQKPLPKEFYTRGGQIIGPSGPVRV